MKRTRMRRVGVKGRARQKRIEAVRPAIIERADGRCQNPFCRRLKPLDIHHLRKRAQGGTETPENLVALCRDCHRATDLPTGQKRLEIHPFIDGFNRPFATFLQGERTQNISLTCDP